MTFAIHSQYNIDYGVSDQPFIFIQSPYSPHVSMYLKVFNKGGGACVAVRG